MEKGNWPAVRVEGLIHVRHDPAYGPLVVRMQGTNEALGKQLLQDSGLPIIAADSMADAATRIVSAVQ